MTRWLFFPGAYRARARAAEAPHPGGPFARRGEARMPGWAGRRVWFHVAAERPQVPERAELGRHRETSEASSTFTRRAVVVGLLQAAGAGIVAGRLYQLQVIDGADIAAAGDDNRLRLMPMLARRGRILDVRGRVLATNRESYRVLAVAERGMGAKEVEAAMARLGALLGLPAVEVKRLSAKVRASSGHRPVIAAQGLSFEQLAAVQLAAPSLPGVSFETSYQRVYPFEGPAQARAMAHVVGYTGAAGLVSLEDDPLLRSADTRIGKAGAEAGLEGELAGVGGRSQVELDARGRLVRRVTETVPKAGADAMLSLDTALQTAAMERFAQEGRAGGAVVLDCRSGEVRVMVSAPTYDGSLLAAPRPASVWGALSRDAGRPLVNRAIAGVYPPGSTFKLVTALAALGAGTISPTERIECWGDVTYAGHTYRCWNRTGHIWSDLHKALRESCDCYFYEAARRTGMERIAAQAEALGLGRTFEAGIAPQAAGLVPTPQWKRRRGRIGWLLGDTILAGIGQGYVLATPLQLAVMTARIATGRAVEPTVLARRTGDPPPAFDELLAPLDVLPAVRKAMVAVVNDGGGTGGAASFDDDGVVMAGKTGTSQVARASADRDRTGALEERQRDHSLFVGYFPAAAPRFAAAAVVEHGGSGGTTAAPLVRDLARLVLSAERDGAFGRRV